MRPLPGRRAFLCGLSGLLAFALLGTARAPERREPPRSATGRPASQPSHAM